MKKVFLSFVILMFLYPYNAYSIDAVEIVKKYHEAFYYQGKDFKARVEMKLINRNGKVRFRELTMLRKNEGPPGGNQKYFIYFHRPADVRRMSFMVYKYPDRDDDRWLYIPALNMVKRIAAKDKLTSFVGSDFTYEDVSGRDIGEDTHEFLREEEIGGQHVYVIKSTPKVKDTYYSYRIRWIDKETFLPLKEEYYNARDEVIKVFHADEIKVIKGYPTIVKRSMKNIESGHRTEVVFTDVDYDTGIKDQLFSERYLKRPPSKWIR